MRRRLLLLVVVTTLPDPLPVQLLTWLATRPVLTFIMVEVHMPMHTSQIRMPNLNERCNEQPSKGSHHSSQSYRRHYVVTPATYPLPYPLPGPLYTSPYAIAVTAYGHHSWIHARAMAHLARACTLYPCLARACTLYPVPCTLYPCIARGQL